jgi:hypothetical protein
MTRKLLSTLHSAAINGYQARDQALSASFCRAARKVLPAKAHQQFRATKI